MFENLSLNAACKEQHEAVIEKGFTPQPVATNLMLIVSELGEACEADRKNRHAKFETFEEDLPKKHIGESGEELYELNDYKHTPIDKEYAQKFYAIAFERSIKDTFEDEIADAFLRLMDLCGAMNIDIEKHIRMKAEYNKLRPTKHGKAY